MDLYKRAVDVATDPKHSRGVANGLVAAEAVLCGLILWKVPYTEIDWTTYMQQINLFVNGEIDYNLIKGDTGPLVYPAFHVYLYSALYYLTDHGTNIFRAQCIFAGLYLITLAFVLACYRRVGAPPWLLVPLVLSKRLHSIFLLRLFNDAWAACALWVSIWALQKRNWTLGATMWGFGVGTKMTILLAAPALTTILMQAVGIGEAIFLGIWVGMVQLLLAWPFLTHETGFVYFQRSFDFGRQFLFKWTVNWRFVGEDIFLSRQFAASLSVVHISLLLFFLQTRWIKPSSSTILDFVKKYTRSMREELEESISKKITPIFVMDTMLASVAIGLLCARSLHYQFYAYLGWTTPYLLWRAGFGPIWVVLNWAVQEICWLTYPSTDLSSLLVVVELVVQLGSVMAGSMAWDAKNGERIKQQ